MFTEKKSEIVTPTSIVVHLEGENRTVSFSGTSSSGSSSGSSSPPQSPVRSKSSPRRLFVNYFFQPLRNMLNFSFAQRYKKARVTCKGRVFLSWKALQCQSTCPSPRKREIIFRYARPKPSRSPTLKYVEKKVQKPQQTHTGGVAGDVGLVAGPQNSPSSPLNQVQVEESLHSPAPASTSTAPPHNSSVEACLASSASIEKSPVSASNQKLPKGQVLCPFRLSSFNLPIFFRKR